MVRSIADDLAVRAYLLDLLAGHHVFLQVEDGRFCVPGEKSVMVVGSAYGGRTRRRGFGGVGVPVRRSFARSERKESRKHE